MNAFVYDLTFKETDSARDRLVKATQHLLASYGYEPTTTRMIARAAKTNLSAINFYFDNKENLVYEAVSQAMTRLAELYKEQADEVRQFLADPQGGKERAWELIDQLLSNQIRRSLNAKAFVNIGLVMHQNEFPASCQDVMATAIIEENEIVLADLIDYVSDFRDRFGAVIAARTITAGIMTYLEKPMLNEELGKRTGLDLGNLEKVEDTMHSFFMKSIEAYAAVDPAVRRV